MVLYQKKVRCADCGFLTLRYQGQERLVEADGDYRATGEKSSGRSVWNTPICFRRAFNLPEEVDQVIEMTPNIDAAQKQDMKRNQTAGHRQPVITKERKCRSFTSWHLGYTPREHQEMNDRVQERWWRVAEVTLAVATGAAVAIVAAKIERGDWF